MLESWEAFNVATKFEISIALCRFYAAGNNICGGGAVTVAENMKPGESSSGNISCNLDHYIMTITWLRLSDNEVVTHEYPARTSSLKKITFRFKDYVPFAHPKMPKNTGIEIPSIEVTESDE